VRFVTGESKAYYRGPHSAGADQEHSELGILPGIIDVH
jgi:hypothetical protein